MPRKDLLALERARVAMIRGARGAADQLARLTKRHPSWTAARTALAVARLATGDLEGFYSAADDAFEADPEDAQALLYATRSALLREGTEAARAYRDRLPSVRSHRGVAVALAFRAEAAAAMDDADALRAALEALDVLDDGEASHEDGTLDDVDRLRDALARRENDPSAPLTSLAELYLGLFASWTRRSPEDVEARAGDELARAPGLLCELPERLGYEDEGTVRILASVLLSSGAPPAPAASWGEVLARIATDGPGTTSGRAALVTFLHEVGTLDASEGVPSPGPARASPSTGSRSPASRFPVPSPTASRRACRRSCER